MPPRKAVLFFYMTGYFDLIQKTAEADGMPKRLSYLIAGQSAHETANYTSRVFIEDLNCFGYKRVPGAKYQLASGRMSPEGNAYAKYASIENSVHEITAWIKRRMNEDRFPPLEFIKTPLQYAQALKLCGYFGDPLSVYSAGISRALVKYV